MVAMIATTAAIAFPRDEKLECVVRGGEGFTYRHASDRASQEVPRVAETGFLLAQNKIQKTVRPTD